MDNIQTSGLTRSEWLLARHPHIGGSEIGVVLGLSTYKTPRQLWEEKRAAVPVDNPENAKMRAGKRQEQLIADYYADESGREVEIDGTIRIHPEYGFVSVSIDRIIKDNGDGRGPGVLECKNTTGLYKATWETALPLTYYCQIQWGLCITGWKWGAVAIQIDGWELEIIPVERDDDFIAMMLEQAKEFWEMVQSGTPPPIVASDTKRMKEEAGTFVEADGVTILDADEVLALMRLSKETEDKIDALKDRIRVYMADRELLKSGERVLARYKTVSAKGYTVEPKSYRKLDIVKPKKGKD